MRARCASNWRGVPAVPELTRPVLDLAGCLPTWAGQGDRVIDGAYIWFAADQLPIQVYAPTGGSVANTFAVAARTFKNLRFDPATANTEVNGQPARAGFPRPTWGDLFWRLPDGSDAYLRTPSMTHDELIELAETLIARPADSTIPAFDPGTTTTGWSTRHSPRSASATSPTAPANSTLEAGCGRPSSTDAHSDKR